MKLALQIAIRFLKSSKLQTLTIILGIAVGVSVQIFIGSLIDGLQKGLVNTAIGNSSQVTIKNEQSGAFIDDYAILLPLVEEADSNIRIVSPSVDGAGAVVKGAKTQPILLRGFNYQQANGIYQFDEKLINGVLPNGHNQVAIGRDLAQVLSLTIHETIEVQIPLVGSQTMTIVGIYDFGSVQVNRSWVITTLASAQTALAINTNQVTSIEMQVKQVFKADVTAMQVAQVVSDPTLVVENWKALNADLLSGLQGQSTSSLMIQVFVMISVVLGIASVLAITVMQKSKQIGILKAMGLKDKDASYVFLFEGAILGFFGAVMGVLFGLGLAFAFTTFAKGTDGKPIIDLYINYGFVALSAAIATLASLLAALIPARKSSKLSIIEVIRNG